MAITLAKKGCQVLLLDENADLVQQMSEYVTQAIQINIRDEKALESLNLKEMDVAVVAIGSDLEASILVTMQLKELGVKMVVAKAGSVTHSKILERVGADRIVFPERDMAVRLANSLVSPSISDFIEVSPGYNMVEIKVPKGLRGLTLVKANVRSKWGVDIIAIKRPQETPEKRDKESSHRFIIAPAATEILQENDILVVIGEEKKIERFRSA
jgi:trk system potassium uptake protein TrkA